jgi:hypothetical protein
VKTTSAENTSAQRRTDFESQKRSVPPTQNLVAMTLDTKLSSNSDANSPAWNEVSEPEAALLIFSVDTGSSIATFSRDGTGVAHVCWYH